MAKAPQILLTKSILYRNRYSKVSTSNHMLDSHSLLKYLFLFFHRENALHAESFVVGKNTGRTKLQHLQLL